VILLDTDITLLADVAELWALFDEMISAQYLGLVDNLSDWYIPSAKVTNWPALVSQKDAPDIRALLYLCVCVCVRACV